MTTYRNVFEIWRDTGKTVPFAVRRWTWHPETYFLVKEVAPKPTVDGSRIYGHAWGDMYLRGALTESNIELTCAGCYQWTFVSLEELYHQ